MYVMVIVQSTASKAILKKSYILVYNPIGTIFMIANNMKKHCFHKVIYDIKGHIRSLLCSNLGLL